MTGPSPRRPSSGMMRDRIVRSLVTAAVFFAWGAPVLGIAFAFAKFGG